mgnify:FL=1
MEMLILWGVPVLTALRGLNRRLFHSYLTFCNLLFSVYVALWSEPAISKFYSLPAEAAAFKPAVSMLVAAFVTFLVLYKVVEQLHPETQREFSFPRPIDKLGGGVCGFLAGMVLINFLAFLLCTVPQKQALSGVVSLPELERAATTSLVSISKAVDRASFQETASRDRLAPLLELARKADPATPEEEGAVPVPLNPQANQQNDADTADAVEESADTAETTEKELEIETTPAEKPAPTAKPVPAEQPAPATKPAPQKEEQPLTFQQSIVKKAIPNAVIRNGQIVVETPMPEE